MRVLIVVNAKAGSSDASLYALIRELGGRRAEVTLRFAAEGERVEDLLPDAAAYDRVVAAGGDGTASSVLYALRGTGIPVAVFPMGTANLLALNLRMPTAATKIADTILEGEQVMFDLGELEYEGAENTTITSGFAIMAGAGYDAAIMETAAPLKATLGPAAYLLAALGNLAPRPASFEIVLDGETVASDGIAVLIVNFGRIQFDLPVTHDSDPRDGQLEVVVLRGKSAVDLIPGVAAVMLDRVIDHPDRFGAIDVYRAQSVSVTTHPELQMQSDGDVLEMLTPFRASVLPSAATLLLPKGSTYASVDPEDAETPLG